MPEPDVLLEVIVPLLVIVALLPNCTEAIAVEPRMLPPFTTFRLPFAPIINGATTTEVASAVTARPEARLR